ncbi:MAG: hypothetical protein SFW08_09885 [Gemmatimonadaceae bacterium]|nr:hypothetical protein [Gemmatimonadaceae bacterium]
MHAEALPAGPPPRRHVIARLARFELQFQRRDFLAWLSALVFLLLTLGYSSNGVIALVSDRGDIPRHAPWALAQAMAGVTAFGQVITAIIAATTVLRDVSLRTQPLLLTTGISWRDYLTGRFVGTLTVLAVVYAMIPAGLIAGHLVALASGATDIAPLRWAAYGWPITVLVIPNVWLVTSAFFCVGALAGGFGPILLLGIGLIGLWQTGLALVQRGIAWGTLVDPFGNAALTLATAEWSAADRALRMLTADPWLIGNRLLWIALAGLALGWTLARWRPVLADGAARVTRRTHRPSGHTAASTITWRSLAPLRGAPVAQQFAAEWRFGVRWALRERGIVALVLLATLNAIANAWPIAGLDNAAVLRATEFHARLFGILIATIYAGELVWRDRETRADALLGALPTAARVRLLGRAVGVGVSLAVLPAALFLVSIVLPLLRGAMPDLGCAARWMLGTSLPEFWGLLAVSVVVHAIVQHKTVAHLLLIAAWIGAITLGLRALAVPWSGYGVC